MDFASIFNNFAFPVAVVIGLFWYIVENNKSHREDLHKKDAQIDKMHEDHAQESKEFTQALNNNTRVLERLCTLMSDKDDKNV